MDINKPNTFPPNTMRPEREFIAGSIDLHHSMLHDVGSIAEVKRRARYFNIISAAIHAHNFLNGIDWRELPWMTILRDCNYLLNWPDRLPALNTTKEENRSALHYAIFETNLSSAYSQYSEYLNNSISFIKGSSLDAYIGVHHVNRDSEITDEALIPHPPKLGNS